ncbi:HV05 protein, partial [Atractosteus spatula]|nr:HV05 protein [Atractosteus spatula]
GVQCDIVLTQSQLEVKRPGESLQLKCAVSGLDVASNVMSWIRQSSERGLEWIVNYYSSSDYRYATAFEGRFSASKDSSNVYLQISSLTAEDTAVYYCARRSTVVVFSNEYVQKLTAAVGIEIICCWKPVCTVHGSGM